MFSFQPEPATDTPTEEPSSTSLTPLEEEILLLLLELSEPDPEED